MENLLGQPLITVLHVINVEGLYKGVTPSFVKEERLSKIVAKSY